MFQAWYYPFYKFGIIHGDPHLGNYSANNDLKINLLDFGCIRFFKSTFVKGVIDLYYSIMTKNEDLAVHAYESWGFENINKDLTLSPFRSIIRLPLRSSSSQFFFYLFHLLFAVNCNYFTLSKIKIYRIN